MMFSNRHSPLTSLPVTRHSPPSRPPDTHLPPGHPTLLRMFLSSGPLLTVHLQCLQHTLSLSATSTHFQLILEMLPGPPSGEGEKKPKEVMTYSFHRFNRLSASHDCLFVCLSRHLTAKKPPVLNSTHTHTQCMSHYMYCSSNTHHFLTTLRHCLFKQSLSLL